MRWPPKSRIRFCGGARHEARIALFLTIAAGLCLPVRYAFAQEAKKAEGIARREGR